MFDVVVVGAGIGGLVAALELAARGQRVVVYEHAPEIGGKIAVAQVDDVEFDTGPSLLTWPAVFEGIFARAGTKLEEHLTLTRPDPAFRYIWPDGSRLDLGPSREAMLQSVRAGLGAAAARELDAFLKYAEGIWDVAVPEFLERDAPDFFGLLKRGLSGLRSAQQIDAFRTMRGAILDRVASPQLRAILLRFATYTGSDPRQTPATLCSIAHVEMGLGAFGVRGGMIEVVRAVARLATDAGVAIHCNTKVDRLALDAGRCRGVVLAGGSHVGARAVICNADVAHLATSLLPASARRAVEVPRDPTTSGVNLVVRARRSEAVRRAGHTVLFSSNVDAEVEDLFDRRRLPAEPTIYACAQEIAHGRTGWPEHEPLFLMANAPALRDAPEDAEAVALLESKMLARMVGSALLAPDDEVVWRRSPAGLAARFPDSGGALYGPASHGWSAAFKRTANAIPDVPGLFVASGSAHPGGGVPMAAMSGRAAARAALEVLR